MPVPFDQLMAQLAGDMAGPQGIKGQTDGLLENQGSPFAPKVPPLTLRDIPGSGEDEGKEGWQGAFPLLPAGQVLEWPKPKGPFQGPTPESAPYMQGKQTAPGVISIDPSEQFWNAWAQRALSRPLNR